MPLTGMTADKIKQLEDQLLDGVPANGRTIGNKRLREEVLKWEDDQYWAVRQRLIDSGSLLQGQGKGGSVRRTNDLVGEVQTETVESSDPTEEPYPDEDSLYAPMAEAIKNGWIRSQSFDNCVVENTEPPPIPSNAAHLTPWTKSNFLAAKKQFPSSRKQRIRVKEGLPLELANQKFKTRRISML